MKSIYVNMVLIIGWAIIGVHRANEKDYAGVFVAGCVLMFSTAHYFYLKIVEKLNQNKDE